MSSCALIVGINRYDQDTSMSELHGAVADAADFADWALDPSGGNVPPEMLFFWTCPAPAAPTPRLATYLQNPTPWRFGAPDFTRPPTVRDIVNTAYSRMVEGLARADPPVGPVKRIYVFFAGHGLQTSSIEDAREVQTCLVAGDFLPGPVTNGLVPCSDLRRGLLATGRFSEVVMFLDCCRSPVNFNQSPPSLGFPNAGQRHVVFYGVGHAAGPGERSFEVPVEAPARGIFTMTLVDGLRRQRSATGELTLEGLDTFVRTNMRDARLPQPQYPYFDFMPRNPPYRMFEALQVAAAPPVLVPLSAAATASIVVSFGNDAIGKTFQLVRADGTPVGAPIVAATAPVTFDDVDAGTLYSLDSTDRTITVGFQHKGPGVTRVQL
jgi:hypothetical protein